MFYSFLHSFSTFPSHYTISFCFTSTRGLSCSLFIHPLLFAPSSLFFFTSWFASPPPLSPPIVLSILYTVLPLLLFHLQNSFFGPLTSVSNTFSSPPPFLIFFQIFFYVYFMIPFYHNYTHHTHLPFFSRRRSRRRSKEKEEEEEKEKEEEEEEEEEKEVVVVMCV